MLNHLKLCSRRIEEISDLELISEKNQSLKNSIIELLSAGDNEDKLKEKININYQKLIEEIKENSNIQLIIKNKNENEILELIDELIIQLKEQNNIKKIESLEKKLLDNLDENSYSELLKLKSQINRE